MTREASSKKYCRVARIIDNVDTVLITITLGGGAGGVALLTIIVAAPIAIAIEGGSFFTGLRSIIGKYGIQKTHLKPRNMKRLR